MKRLAYVACCSAVCAAASVSSAPAQRTSHLDASLPAVGAPPTIHVAQQSPALPVVTGAAGGNGSGVPTGPGLSTGNGLSTSTGVSSGTGLGAGSGTDVGAGNAGAPEATTGSSAPAGSDAGSWAAGDVQVVLSRGLFDGTPASFRPQDPLTAGTLARAVAGLTGRPLRMPPDPDATVSIARLDAAFVDALGLRSAARSFYLGARRAGLQPPRRFGTEAVARLIGLRLNHPSGQDALELQPHQPATRAEAAFSAARMLELLPPRTVLTAGAPGGGSRAPENSIVAGVAVAARTFALPDLTSLQQQVLQTAVSLIGYPYVWGGEDEKTELGFDCSGFVWRVYKLTRYAEAPALGGTIQGRSAAAMSGEVPRTERIGLEAIEPGDVLFFGNGPGTRPQDVSHTAIYLGGGWLIQSSTYGVALAPLDGWYSTSFAWARRPLTEVGQS